jgi:hypothetical protein
MFKPDERMIIQGLASAIGTVDIVYSTRHLSRKPDVTMPGHLWIDIRGDAGTLDEALVPFANAGLSMLPVLVLSANVLTAGHCTEDWGASTVYVTFEPEADFVPVELDPDGVFDPGDAYTGTPYTHPNYPDVDIGVVVLDQPVTNVGYGTLPEAGIVDSFATGQRLTAVGYGVRNFDVGGGPPRIGELATRYRATVEFLDVVGPLGDLYIKLREASAGSGGEGSCFGDSGGPYLLPDQTTVVAVTSFGTNSRCAGVGYAQRVDLPEILNWLEEFL